MSTPTRFVLASSSRYRQAQMAALGINAICVAPDIDESPWEHEAPQALAERLAQAKAQKVATQHKECLVIASDQVAWVQDETGKGHILGKPHTHAKAIQQLTLCSGRLVSFFSALTLIDTNSQRISTQTDRTDVYFKTLSAQQIDAYLHDETPYDCAGSFKSEGKGVLLFERIESRDPNALIGLPVMLLRDMLADFKIDLLLLATSMGK